MEVLVEQRSVLLFDEYVALEPADSICPVFNILELEEQFKLVTISRPTVLSTIIYEKHFDF